MTIKILNKTYTSIGKNKYGSDIGTVDVDLGNGRIVTAQASCNDGSISVGGFVGRYRTSNKAWVAHVTGHNDNIFAYFGRDDRSGRYNKMQGISWEPEIYNTICNPKFWLPVGA